MRSGTTVAEGRAGLAFGSPSGSALPLTVLCLVVAVTATLGVAFANQAYFEVVNGVIGARDGVVRGLIFSSWLLLLGGIVVAARPTSFALGIGDLPHHVPLVVGTIALAAIATAGILRLVGSTPYSDASPLIEIVVVPVTEELVFRAVLLSLLLAAMVRLYERRRATILAIVIDGIAFGCGHLANATSLASPFVVGQAIFAAVLGFTAAFLMVRTRSVYPAMLLHGVVNAVVVLV